MRHINREGVSIPAHPRLSVYMKRVLIFCIGIFLSLFSQSSEPPVYQYVSYDLEDEASYADFDCTPVEPERPTGTACGHDWVQLWEGGPRWATTNLGASKPEEYGGYYMYGGTIDITYALFAAWDNYPYKGTHANDDPYSKYGVSGEGGLVLETEDDAAAQVWGCEWRIPTNEEMDELLTKCDVTYNKSKRGYTFTSKEDPSLSIFMPSAGYKNASLVTSVGRLGRYLTATSTKTPKNKPTDCLTFYWKTNSSYDEDKRPEAGILYTRYMGMSVRPVVR